MGEAGPNGDFYLYEKLIGGDSKEVRVVCLEPMRLASSLGYGPNPEELAGEKRHAWMAANGLLEGFSTHRYLGFNNPSPSPGSPNYGYGYEEWVTVDPGIEPGDGAEIKEFPGGLYAVTGCQLRGITDRWRELAVWCENGRYSMAGHRWLEELLTP